VLAADANHYGGLNPQLTSTGITLGQKNWEVPTYLQVIFFPLSRGSPDKSKGLGDYRKHLK